MKKNPEQIEMTQKNIQEAFGTLYAKHSIDKIIVKDICNFSGYNRSTFYQYYADVYDVLHKSENQLLNMINEFVIRFVKQADYLNALCYNITMLLTVKSRSFLFVHIT
jgi:hypothetical protein